MSEASNLRRIEDGNEVSRVRAISVPARPTLRIVQGNAPLARARRRKAFRLEFFGQGYSPFRIR